MSARDRSPRPDESDSDDLEEPLTSPHQRESPRRATLAPSSNVRAIAYAVIISLAIIAVIEAYGFLAGQVETNTAAAASSSPHIDAGLADFANAASRLERLEHVLTQLVAGGGAAAVLPVAGDAEKLAPQVIDVSSKPLSTPSSSSSPAVSSFEPRTTTAFPSWRADRDELARTWWHFDRYDSVEYSHSDKPSSDQGWWPSDDPNFAVGQFDFDVTHRRFLSAPEAYEKYNVEQKYDPEAFRAAGVPILWGDAWGHVHWNEEAERQFYHLVLEQQHSSRGVPCNERQYVVNSQWHWGGFFSRYHNAVVLMMSALQTGREILLDPLKMTIKDTDRDDFLEEGINRYFMPFSSCATDEWTLKQLKTQEGRSRLRPIHHVEDMYAADSTAAQFWFFDSDVYDPPEWKVPRYHLPHRKHMFEYGEGVKHPQRYKDQAAMLADRTQHVHEHIYPHPTSTVFRQQEVQYAVTDSAPERLVLQFYWYMLLMWHYAPLPRIQSSATMLRQHWSSHLTDQRIGLSKNPARTRHEYAHALDHSAAMMIRRGDKAREDGYAKQHGFFRDVSLYGWPLMKRAQSDKQPFTSLFFMSDDSPLLAETDACVKASKPAKEPDWNAIQPPNSQNGQMRPSGCRSEASEFIFSGIPLTWNVYAPQACFDPFLRVGFEQFLVSMHYVVRYASYAIGHRSSNVGRILEELIYASRQLDPSIESIHTVYEDAVDDYRGSNTTMG